MQFPRWFISVLLIAAMVTGPCGLLRAEMPCATPAPTAEGCACCLTEQVACGCCEDESHSPAAPSCPCTVGSDEAPSPALPASVRTVSTVEAMPDLYTPVWMIAVDRRPDAARVDAFAEPALRVKAVIRSIVCVWTT